MYIQEHKIINFVKSDMSDPIEIHFYMIVSVSQ